MFKRPNKEKFIYKQFKAGSYVDTTIKTQVLCKDFF